MALRTLSATVGDDLTMTQGDLPATFTCPRCGMSSAHPTDLAEGYCGACHAWTGDAFRPARDGDDTADYGLQAAATTLDADRFDECRRKLLASVRVADSGSPWVYTLWDEHVLLEMPPRDTQDVTRVNAP